jgi:hypothetical protein
MDTPVRLNIKKRKKRSGRNQLDINSPANIMRVLIHVSLGTPDRKHPTANA